MVIFTHSLIPIFVYIIPGWVCLSLVWPHHQRPLPLWVQLTLAPGLTLALHNLLLLWTRTLGLQIGQQLVWGISTLGFIGLVLMGVWGGRFSLRNNRLTTPDWVMLIVVLWLGFTRVYVVRHVVAPAWGDSLQHAMIAQLMLDHNGLFDSWEPYATFYTFTYHYAFHLAVANWIWMSTWIQVVSTPQATLMVGQFLNELAVLAVYPLAYMFGARWGATAQGENSKEDSDVLCGKWAGVMAVIIAGFMSQMPAFYVNWGRYTQLTGQVVFPALLCLLIILWTDWQYPQGKRWRIFGLLVLLAAGIALSHYRVTIVAVAAGGAWVITGLWTHRTDLRTWRQKLWGLAGVGGIAIGLILPWIATIWTGYLPTLYMARAKLEVDDSTTALAFFSDIQIWTQIGTYYPSWLWQAALIAIIWLLIRFPIAMFTYILWAGITFLLTNPFLVQLPGTGAVTNFLLLIGTYIVIAVVIGTGFSDIFTLMFKMAQKALGQWRNDNIAQSDRVFAGAMALLVLLTMGWFTPKQLSIIDPNYQMVTSADVSAFEWIDEHVPEDAWFLINSFLAYGDTLVAASDAGWWLTFYTQRKNTVPPMIGAHELTEGDTNYGRLRQLVIDVNASAGEQTQLRSIFCTYALSHVYLGDKQGRVGFGIQPLMTEAWLQDNPDFELLYQQEQAQVWRFVYGCGA
ncbi:MAG: hypothetical protein AAF639_20495 [Chloroflexota bacterium]